MDGACMRVATQAISSRWVSVNASGNTRTASDPLVRIASSAAGNVASLFGSNTCDSSPRVFAASRVTFSSEPTPAWSGLATIRNAAHAGRDLLQQLDAFARDIELEHRNPGR